MNTYVNRTNETTGQTVRTHVAKRRATKARSLDYKLNQEVSDGNMNGFNADWLKVSTLEKLHRDNDWAQPVSGDAMLQLK